MFDKITLHTNPESSGPLDVGLLAETILYFNKTQLVIDFRTAVPLISQLSFELFIELIEMGLIEVTYLTNFPITLTETEHGLHIYKYDYGGLAGNQKYKPTKDNSQTMGIRALLEKCGVKEKYIIKAAIKFKELVTIETSAEHYALSTSIEKHTIYDSSNIQLSRFLVQDFLSTVAPDFIYAKNNHFNLIELGEKFLIDTSLDFNELNKMTIDGSNEYSAANIAHHFFSIRSELGLALHHGSSFAVNSRASKFSEILLRNSIVKINPRLDDIHLFQHHAIDKVKTIRSAINNKERSFQDFLELLEKAKPFKHWVNNIENDQQLLTEYIQSLSSIGWADKLPSKTARFSIFSGFGILADITMMGGLGTLASLGLNAVDSLYVDKILKGWKPNMFITDASEFLSKK